jgi:hypothetical protein
MEYEQVVLQGIVEQVHGVVSDTVVLFRES